MIYFIVLLIIIIIGLLVYILMINRQINRITEILGKRLHEQTSQIVSVDLINRHINKLANNINECLKAEEKLRLLSVKEEKKFKELMANISHDLRTPLTAIKGYQQMLEIEDMTDEQKEKLSIAIKNTKILEQLIEHFFEHTYMVNSAPKSHFEKINLANQITECLIASITMFEESQMEVQFDDSAMAYVMADREMLDRILHNLIRNSLQHAKDKIQVRIVERKEGERNMIGFSFSNEIADENNVDASRIFDRFYTTDYARKNSTGLGLSIVKLLAEQMDGVANAHISNKTLNITVLLPRA